MTPSPNVSSQAKNSTSWGLEHEVAQGGLGARAVLPAELDLADDARRLEDRLTALFEVARILVNRSSPHGLSDWVYPASIVLFQLNTRSICCQVVISASCRFRARSFKN